MSTRELLDQALRGLRLACISATGSTYVAPIANPLDQDHGLMQCPAPDAPNNLSPYLYRVTPYYRVESDELVRAWVSMCDEAFRGKGSMRRIAQHSLGVFPFLPLQSDQTVDARYPLTQFLWAVSVSLGRELHLTRTSISTLTPAGRFQVDESGVQWPKSRRRLPKDPGFDPLKVLSSPIGRPRRAPLKVWALRNHLRDRAGIPESTLSPTLGAYVVPNIPPGDLPELSEYFDFDAASYGAANNMSEMLAIQAAIR